MNGFSSGLRLTGLDDFITPSQACTMPVKSVKKAETTKGVISMEDDGSYLQISEEGNNMGLETAKITLNDCLACSGCITSAESVLVTAQSQEEFFSRLAEKQKYVFVVSISPQARTSLAAYFGLSQHDTHMKLVAFFRELGINYIFDTSFSREFSLIEATREFIARYRASDSKSKLPMLASSCPGWVCYAEKTHPEVLPYISSTKSPQQIMGTLVKTYFAEKIGKQPHEIYHVSVMPCYDKKLEASRSDFQKEDIRDVDCVLTAGEILEIIQKRGIDFCGLMHDNVALQQIEKRFSNVRDEGIVEGVPGGSGGLVEYLFRYAAKELFGVSVTEFNYKVGRNKDSKTLTLQVEGKPALQFATAYGFRNLQNVIRRLKKSSPLHFVEVMACPSGCLNGGGMIRPTSPETPKALVTRLRKIYADQTVKYPDTDQSRTVWCLYKEWVGDSPYSIRAKELFHTQYHGIEKTTSALSIHCLLYTSDAADE
eukprot:TRINITY_DN6835_c0_g1_i1.p1 TRINITY_DN6835_c0_g1~~TRINITY_DN6835_c0_g1_i1.p1  ORF type:complete len:484 (+),score=57.56 TRINITY_DN6835_c0_g1_i1:49-1500(+)